MHIVEATETSESLLVALRELAAELAPQGPVLTLARLDAIVASDSSRLLVARGDDGQPLGMLLLVWYPLLTGWRYWIEDVVVAPAARGRGVGEALVRRAIDIARESGAETIDLTSRPAREAAHRLYRRLGFEPRETNVYRLDISSDSSRS